MTRCKRVLWGGNCSKCFNNSVTVKKGLRNRISLEVERRRKGRKEGRKDLAVAGAYAFPNEAGKCLSDVAVMAQVAQTSAFPPIHYYHFHYHKVCSPHVNPFSTCYTYGFLTPSSFPFRVVSIVFLIFYCFFFTVKFRRFTSSPFLSLRVPI